MKKLRIVLAVVLLISIVPLAMGARGNIKDINRPEGGPLGDIYDAIDLIQGQINVGWNTIADLGARVDAIETDLRIAWDTMADIGQRIAGERDERIAADEALQASINNTFVVGVGAVEKLLVSRICSVLCSCSPQAEAQDSTCGAEG